MLRRILGSALALALLATMALPFAREAYYRHAVSQQLIGGLDRFDRAAFASWNGSALSFVDSLRDRCVRAHGGDATACDRYRIASE